MLRSVTIAVIAVLLLSCAEPVLAAKNKEDAAQQAARQHGGRVLSVQEKNQNKKSEYSVKVLTKDGVVKTVRVPKDEKKDKN